RRRKNAPHPNPPPQMGGGDLKDAMCVKFATLASSRGVGGERRTASKKMCPPDRGWGGSDTSLPTNGISLSRRHSPAAPANRHCRRAAPHPNPPPLWAGLSHLENPESDPRLGGTRRSAAAATPWNRTA